MSNTLPQHIKDRVQEEADKLESATQFEGLGPDLFLSGAEFLYSLLPSPGVKEIDVTQDALNYASDFGNSKPEQFTEHQVGRLHGYIDGYEAAQQFAPSATPATEKERGFTIVSATPATVEDAAKEYADWLMPPDEYVGECLDTTWEEMRVRVANIWIAGYQAAKTDAENKNNKT